MNGRKRFHLVLLLIASLAGACSSRVTYEESLNEPSSVAVNINTATPEELEKLPGIGTKTAELIVNFRTANGPFRRVEHLMSIRGISERRFAELRPLIRVE
ncbi:MAG: helix-hairpin-helix domain-containing protein [Pyrinomonadaceae bacterium]|nr:helix-hairpin-helix domain-containing protein [Pyrinomonadaceae bacterium]